MEPKFFFFFSDTAPPEIYPLPLHAALPISTAPAGGQSVQYRSAAGVEYRAVQVRSPAPRAPSPPIHATRSGSFSSARSEEHTSELQSQSNLVCRLLLEKKKQSIRYARIVRS